MPRRSAAPGNARKPSPCSKRPRSKARATRPCSAPMAARWPKPATTIRPWKCSSARIRLTSRIGTSCRRRAPCSISSGRHADAQRHYSTALKIAPDEPSILSNLGLSYALVKEPARSRSHASSRRRAASGGSAGTAKSRARRRPTRPLRRSRGHRPRRLAGGARPRQRRLSAADARPSQRLARKRRAPRAPTAGEADAPRGRQRRPLIEWP